jgi:tetratricopeptide (TPR) repeat protein
MLQRIGEGFMNAGFPVKAYYYWKEALDLDGDSSCYYTYLLANEFYNGNYEKAVEYGDKAYAIDSTTAFLNIFMTLSHIFHGNYEISLKYLNSHLESLKAIGQLEIANMWIIGYIYWKNGYKEKAEYYFEETIENSNRMIELGRGYTLLPDVYYDLAGVYAFRGETDKAFKNLRIFSQKNCVDIKWGLLLKNDPLFNSIRDEPEFRKIQKEVAAKYLSEHEKVRKWLEEQGELPEKLK